VVVVHVGPQDRFAWTAGLVGARIVAVDAFEELPRLFLDLSRQTWGLA
jgi:hypothetical protein